MVKRHSLIARHIPQVLPGHWGSRTHNLQLARALRGSMYKEGYGQEHRLFKSAVANHHGIDNLPQEKCILSLHAGEKLELKLPGTALPLGVQEEILSESSSCWHRWKSLTHDCISAGSFFPLLPFALPTPSPLTFSLQRHSSSALGPTQPAKNYPYISRSSTDSSLQRSFFPKYGDCRSFCLGFRCRHITLGPPFNAP